MKKSRIFMLIIKVLIICSILLIHNIIFSTLYCDNHAFYESPKFKFIYEIKGSNQIRFQLEHCNCQRTLNLSKIDPAENFNKNYSSKDIFINETSCSSDAYLRGPGQKVVSYSYYGNIDSPYNQRRGFIEGIVGNLELMSIYYPGWVMRVYYDIEDGDPIMQILCDLACRNALLDICNVRQLPGTPQTDASNIFPMVWRFFPTIDRQVDVFASRDLDSHLSAREVAAVREWREKSNYSLHAMRDHPNHGFKLLGGAWDADMTRNVVQSDGNVISARRAWKITWKNILKDRITYSSRHLKGPDQDLIERLVWNPWGHTNVFQHDAYTCEKFQDTVGWPTKRQSGPNNFVGSVVKENRSLVEKCPIRCRKNPQWEYC